MSKDKNEKAMVPRAPRNRMYMCLLLFVVIGACVVCSM